MNGLTTLRPGPRANLRRLVDASAGNDLLTYASAISFQILSALVPFLLFGFGLLGFLQLDDVWSRELAPRLETGVSDAAFALAVGACWLAAIAVVVVSPLIYGDVHGALAAVLFLGRWAVAGALLLLAVAVLLHYAPERRSPLDWVTFGAVLIMAGWLLMSLGFGVYLRSIADYNSILQIDALMRR